MEGSLSEGVNISPLESNFSNFLTSNNTISENKKTKIDKDLFDLIFNIIKDGSLFELWKEPFYLSNDDINQAIDIQPIIRSKYLSNQAVFNKLEQLLIDNNLMEPIKSVLDQAFANDGSYHNQDNLYVIEYNNSPLYYLNLDDFNIINNKNNNEKEIIEHKLKESKNTAIENNQLSQYLNNNLVNVSNNIFYDPNTNSLNGNKYLIKSDSVINKTQKLIHLNDNNSSKSNINANHLTNVFQVDENKLSGQLNLLPTDSIELLKNGYGILQSIYYYNKNLNRVSSTIPNGDIKDQVIKSVDEIPVLWQSDKILEPTYYGEYLSKEHDINAPLHNESTKQIFNSKAELDNSKNTTLQLQPIQLFLMKDHFDKIINFEYLDKNLNIANGKPITDGYGTNEEQAYQNALNKIEMYADVNYVYYDNKLVRNEVSKLYTLDLKKLTNTTSVYTFIQYKYMYNYLYDYVKLHSMNVYN